MDRKATRLSGTDRADQGVAALVVEMVALATATPRNEILDGRHRGRAAAHARQMAMYLIHVIFQWPLDRIGAAFGRDRTTAGHACRRVEDRRDDQGTDEMLDRLEACLRLSPCAPGWPQDPRA
ncbi:MAG: chromosomal replication initiator DnaA [Caulobacterales bacterium]|nr:chromosomal replication initiator DnaA [Caulobacterales bacterium]